VNSLEQDDNISIAHVRLASLHNLWSKKHHPWSNGTFLRAFANSRQMCAS
jgi:hypothetical protein